MFGKKKDEATKNEHPIANEKVEKLRDENERFHKSMESGFQIGYSNAEKVFRNAIDQIAEENRRLKKENLFYKTNNKSLAAQNEALKKRLKELGDSYESLDGNSYGGDDGDALGYFELFP